MKKNAMKKINNHLFILLDNCLTGSIQPEGTSLTPVRTECETAMEPLATRVITYLSDSKCELPK